LLKKSAYPKSRRSFPQEIHYNHVVACGRVAQLGEHLLCKQGVTGSIPVTSTKYLLQNQFVTNLAIARLHQFGVRLGPITSLSTPFTARVAALESPADKSSA
jgi:hypothetical protein